MTSAKADVAVMMSVGDPTARGRMVQSSLKLLSARGASDEADCFPAM